MDLTILLISSVCLLILLYFYLIRNNNYWKKLNIPEDPDAIPFFGHMLPVVFGQKTIGQLITHLYKKHPQQSMVGFFNFQEPGLLIRDPELIKNVLITNFNSFAENNMIITGPEEPLLAENPFFNSGAKWKSNRSKLTATFTGSKLKTMSYTMYEITKKLTNFMDDKIKKHGQHYEVETKCLFSRVTAEVYANVGFGMEGHCLQDGKESESFDSYAQMVFAPTFKNRIKFYLIFNLPFISGLFGFKMFSKEFENNFVELVDRTINQKPSGEKNFMDMVLEQEKKEGLTEDKALKQKVLSHMSSLFVDTYETTSVTLHMIPYFLATNPRIQEKLREEVFQVVSKHNGALNQEVVNDMLYMDQVIFESLRLHPVLHLQIKKCTDRFELRGCDGLSCWVEKNVKVYIPVGGLDDDPNIWDNPKEYRPERFDKDVVNERHKTAFLPFGEGPRMCPGRKLATMVMKMTLSAIIMKYKIELSPKTKLPLKIDRFTLLPYIQGGMWIKFKPLKC